MISPNVLMISPDILNIPQCTSCIPHMHIMISPNVFMISPSPMHSWYPPMYLTPPDVLMIVPQCTEHPPMYWTTHYTGWFYVCIKSINGNILVFSCLIVNLYISNVTQSNVLQFVENLKKHIWFFCRFSSENVTIWNGPVSIHVITRYM